MALAKPYAKMASGRSMGLTHFNNKIKTNGREVSFTDDAKRALFDYLEELEEDCGMDIELDVVAIDCEYVEYSDAKEAAGEYCSEHDDIEDCVEWLRERTQVITFDGGIIIASF